ncbi:MAG: hypothetical protein ACFFD4_26745 [Candidatus Odinarchaeota archaeon]
MMSNDAAEKGQTGTGLPQKELVTAGNQVVDKRCVFLREEDQGYYSCLLDMDGEELESCADCNACTVFVKKRKKTL